MFLSESAWFEQGSIADPTAFIFWVILDELLIGEDLKRVLVDLTVVLKA